MTILLAHSDLGFTLWLGLALCRTGHSALPVTDPAQAKSLQRELGVRFDAVIVEPGLPGLKEWLAALKSSNPRLRVFEAAAATPDPLSPPSIVELLFERRKYPERRFAGEFLPLAPAGAGGLTSKASDPQNAE